MSSNIRHEFIMKCPAFTKYQPNTRVKGGWERNDFDSQMSPVELCVPTILELGLWPHTRFTQYRALSNKKVHKV